MKISCFINAKGLTEALCFSKNVNDKRLRAGIVIIKEMLDKKK